MRGYYLQTRWFISCFWNTWSIHRKDKNLDKALAKVYEGYKNRQKREDFQKTVPFQYKGESYFIHAYWLRCLPDAYKVFIGARLINDAKILGPQISVVLLRKIAGRPSVIQLQRSIEGKGITCWNAEMGYQLANDLKKWHKITRESVIAAGFFCRTVNTGWITKRIRVLLSSPYLDRLENYHPQILDQACEYLKQSSLIGPLALSHGDIHRGNLLLNTQGKFVWLDLDAINYFPIFQELAWVQFFILDRHPDAAENLEKNYFENNQELRELWRRFRLHWCVIQGVYHASRLLRVGKCLPGHKPGILKHYERTMKGANIAFQKAKRAQNLIEMHGNLKTSQMRPILSYINGKTDNLPLERSG